MKLLPLMFVLFVSAMPVSAEELAISRCRKVTGTVMGDDENCLA